MLGKHQRFELRYMCDQNQKHLGSMIITIHRWHRDGHDISVIPVDANGTALDAAVYIARANKYKFARNKAKEIKQFLVDTCNLNEVMIQVVEK